ncbi:MAG: hypothetical protein JST39_04260 [Bacteroidetes bacterium]|nr:hypothetical protein [Bacteroidota bacterium]
MTLRRFILLFVAVLFGQFLRAELEIEVNDIRIQPDNCVHVQKMPWEALASVDIDPDDILAQQLPERQHRIVKARFRAPAQPAAPTANRQEQENTFYLPQSTARYSQYNRLLLPSYYHFLYRLTLF